MFEVHTHSYVVTHSFAAFGEHLNTMPTHSFSEFWENSNTSPNHCPTWLKGSRCVDRTPALGPGSVKSVLVQIGRVHNTTINRDGTGRTADTGILWIRDRVRVYVLVLCIHTGAPETYHVMFSTLKSCVRAYRVMSSIAWGRGYLSSTCTFMYNNVTLLSSYQIYDCFAV